MSTTVRVYTRYAELSLPLVILDNPSDAVQLASHQSHGVLTQLYADDDCEAHLYFARRTCTMVSFIDCAMVLLRSSVDLRLHAFKSSSQNFICLGIDCCCCCCVIYLSMQYWDCGFLDQEITLVFFVLLAVRTTLFFRFNPVLRLV